MALRDVAENYFSKINSMATRMHLDMKETKAAYEDLWDTLNYKEQEQVLSESIIKPEVCLKYGSGNPKASEQCFTAKLIVDENFSYYDEHSGPFSFKTKSQRDLTLFTDEEAGQKQTLPIKSTVKPKVIISIYLVCFINKYSFINKKLDKLCS